MKATVDAKDLAAALAKVTPFIRHSSHPALSMVHLTVNPDAEQLQLTAGDLEQFCRTSVPLGGTVRAPGATLAPAAFLAKVVARLHGDISLEHADGDLVVATAKAQASMPTGNVDEYPHTTWPTTGATTIDDDLWGRLQRILHAASTDTARPTLCTVNLADGWACCTDSYRLAAAEIPDHLNLTVPATFVNRAAKVLDGTPSATVDDTSVALTDGTTTMWTRQHQDEFPRWQGLVPADTARRWSFTAPVEPLLDALALIDTLPGSDGLRATPTKLRNHDGVLEASALVQDAGAARTTVDGATCDGDWPDLVGIQAGYLRQAAQATGATDITVWGTDAQKPIVVAGGGLTQIIMPVRIS